MDTAHIAVVMGAVTVLVFAYALWRVVQDRRRPSNGLWLLAGFCLLWLTGLIASLTQGEETTWLQVAVLLPVLAVPLLLVGASIALIANTPIVVRREGLRIATLVPLAIAAAILGTLAVLLLWVLSITGGNGETSWSAILLLPVLIIPGVIVVFELIAYSGYALLYPRLGTPDDADVVVVLGAGLNGDQVTPLLASRLDRGIEVFRAVHAAGRDPVIVVSGGKGSDEKVAEADAMGDYLLRHDIPAQSIVRERNSTTTAENLEFTVTELADAHVDWKRMAIVTSDFHVLRSASLARQLGIDASATGARTAIYYMPSAFLREFAATVVHYRRGTAIACALAIGLWFGLVGAAWLVGHQDEPENAPASIGAQY